VPPFQALLRVLPTSQARWYGRFTVKITTTGLCWLPVLASPPVGLEIQAAVRGQETGRRPGREVLQAFLMTFAMSCLLSAGG
jgi:hypothetical protein